MLQQVIYKVIIYISTLYNHEKKILQTIVAHWQLDYFSCRDQAARGLHHKKHQMAMNYGAQFPFREPGPYTR
jgi:hypothetical protein